MSVNFTPEQKNYKDYQTFQSFRMFVIENFPFINEDFDSMTYYQMLCKVVAYLKDTIDNNKSIQENQTNVFNSFVELQNYVNTYFDNLDVQYEINNKLDEMASNGVLQSFISEFFRYVENNFNERIEEQNVVLMNTNTEIDTLKTRMSTFTSLQNGSTSGDAELQDLRIAYNGKTYNSAGDSVRSQFQEVHDILGDYVYEFDKKYTSNMFKEFEMNVPAGTEIYFSIRTVNDKPFKEGYLYGFREDGTYYSLVITKKLGELYFVRTTENYVKLRAFAQLTEDGENLNGRFILGFSDNKTLITHFEKLINQRSLFSNYKNVLIRNTTDVNDKNNIMSNDFNKICDFKVYFFYYCNQMLNAPEDNLYGVFYSIPFQPNYTAGVVQYYINYKNDMYHRISYGSPESLTWTDWKKEYTNEDAEIEKSEELIDKLNKHTAKIFKKVCCVGDSFTAGYIVDSDNVAHGFNEDYSWPHYMATSTGNEYYNCGVSGANAKTWQESSQGLQKAKNFGNVQAYIIGLAINDASGTDRGLEVGSVEDIGTDNVNYYAQYSKLIRELHTISPKAKIFVQTCPDKSSKYIPYNTAITDIASQYKEEYNVHVLDLRNYKEVYLSSSIVNDAKRGHYTAIGYQQFAEILEYVLSDYINNNIKDFQDVAFI